MLILAHFHMINSAQTGTIAQVAVQLCQGHARTRSHDLHAAVGQVARPSDQPQPGCPPRDKPPKAYSLDPAEEDPSGRLLGLAHGSVRRRRCRTTYTATSPATNGAMMRSATLT